MNLTKSYDIACIGNYTKDTIVTPNGTTYVDGGAMNYAAHAAKRLGLNVLVVTRHAREDQRVSDKFLESGIDVQTTITPKSTCIKLEYPTLNPDIRNLYVTSTAGSISVAEVQDIQTRAAVIGTTLRGEIELDAIQILRGKNLLLSLDVQGFVRVLRGQDLVYEPWEQMSTILPLVDILKSDQVEAQFLTSESDIQKAARFFANHGAKEIVLTHKDGLLVYAGDEYHDAGFFPKRLDGRSGRGDTCLGSYTAMRLSKPPAEACIWAAALTSLKMEKLGPYDRDFSELEAFIHTRYS